MVSSIEISIDKVWRAAGKVNLNKKVGIEIERVKEVLEKRKTMNFHLKADF